jgi:hypothetical protein
MGSFVRFLIDTYGIAAFQQVYAHGDFHAVYGKPVDALISEWEVMVDGLQIDEARVELARLRYGRGSIFQKTCARTLAELRRRAEGAEAQGDWEKALRLRRDIAHHQGKDEQGGVEIATLLVRLGRHDEAIQILDQLLADARAEGFKIMPLCPFVNAQRKRHPQRGRAALHLQQGQVQLLRQVPPPLHPPLRVRVPPLLHLLLLPLHPPGALKRVTRFSSKTPSSRAGIARAAATTPHGTPSSSLFSGA